MLAGMSRLRSLLALALAAALLHPLGVPPALAAPPPADEPSAPQVSADAAVLIDASSGRVLWGRDADVPRDPASTTKMMTALVALQLGRPDELITVGAAAAATPGSSAGLRAGERYRLEDLLRGLLLRSGNDAAVAIAVHLAGSVPAFAALMNARARQLGLENTNFANPHGLTAPLHHSSAHDLALIARAGLQLPAFATLVDSAEGTMQGRDPLQREIRRELRNTNRLLLAYDWVDGVKTGTTGAAGNCLVASGTRGGMRLIAVVLHSDDRWGDALRMLQWGFVHFSQPVRAPAGTVVARLPVSLAPRRDAAVEVVAGAGLQAVVALDELPWLTVRRDLPDSISAPVRAGQRLGTLTLLLAGQPMASVPLLAARGVPRAAPLRLLLRHLLPL